MDSDKIYTIKVTNNAPRGIWYRLYNEANGYAGYEIKSNETQNISTTAKYTIIKGQIWDNGDPEIWNPTFINKIDFYFESPFIFLNITGVFGPRLTSSIKVFLACLAGPASSI